MRFLFLTGSINQGGAEFQILALAKLFQDNGHEVQVLALTDYEYYKPFLKQNNIRYDHLFNHQSKIKRLLLTSKKIRESNPDVVIAYLRVVGQFAAFARVLSGIKFKLIVGERTSLVIPAYDRYYFNLMRLCDAFTVNSISKFHYIKNRFPFLEKKLFFLPNIIDLTSFKLNPIPDDDFRNISFVGRISPEKNVLQIIGAFETLVSKYPNIKLHLYGDTRDNEYVKAVKEKLRSDKLPLGSVHLHGKSKDILQVYRDTHLLCLVSDFEGFSNVICEALSCGIPVVASDIEENRFLVEDGVNGFLVDSRSVASIANGVEKYILLSKEDKAKMHVTNRAKSESLFNTDSLYKQYLSVVNSTMKKTHVNS